VSQDTHIFKKLTISTAKLIEHFLLPRPNVNRKIYLLLFKHSLIIIRRLIHGLNLNHVILNIIILL